MEFHTEQCGTDSLLYVKYNPYERRGCYGSLRIFENWSNLMFVAHKHEMMHQSVEIDVENTP